MASKVHYIEMSGDHGCLPDHCDVSLTLKGAIDSLGALFDDVLTDSGRHLGVRNQLKLYRHCELPRGAGAEYCEIVECDCTEPWVHSDSMSAEDFDEYLDE
jgi:hypothetical protein